MNTRKNLTIVGIAILSISLLFLLSIKFNQSYLDKLKASVSQTNDAGDTLWIECDAEVMDVNETTNCSVKAEINGSNRSAVGFQGLLKYSNNIKISNITASSVFNILGKDNDEEMVYMGDGTSGTGTITIATFKATSTASGTGTIKLVDIDKPTEDSEGSRLYLLIDSNNNQTYSYFDEVNYEIKISSAPTLSSDATLKSLKVGSEEVLSNLEVAVPNSVSSIAVTATTNDEKARVTSGTGNVSLNVGENTVNVVVLAEDQTATKTYSLKIIRQSAQQKSSINTLSNLKITSNNTKLPFTTDFSSDVTEYVASVSNDISSIAIEATATDSKATINQDNIGVKSLNVGENKFDVIVTAENGDTKTYKITVTREAKIDQTKSSDNSLKSLSVTNAVITPEFSSDVTEYTSTVSSEISKVKISAEANDSKATIKKEDLGDKDLSDGANVFSITVTAEDNSVKIYTINITKEKENTVITCSLKITSSVYNVDENNSGISIPLDDSSDKIISNIKTTADVSIENDKIKVKCGEQEKEYKINRYWAASTGQNVVRYTVIITGLIVIIGVLFVLKNKFKK